MTLHEVSENVFACAANSNTTGVYCPTYNVLATGGNFIVNMYPFAGKGCNPDLWIQALKEYLSCVVNSFIPGHGPVAGKDEVKEFLAYMVEVRTVMKELIAEGEPKEDAQNIWRSFILLHVKGSRRPIL